MLDDCVKEAKALANAALGGKRRERFKLPSA